MSRWEARGHLLTTFHPRTRGAWYPASSYLPRTSQPSRTPSGIKVVIPGSRPSPRCTQEVSEQEQPPLWAAQHCLYLRGHLLQWPQELLLNKLVRPGSHQWRGHPQAAGEAHLQYQVRHLRHRHHHHRPVTNCGTACRVFATTRRGLTHCSIQLHFYKFKKYHHQRL